MPVTKRGVYHNLKESKYVVSNGEITFFFSSDFYMDKFMIEYKEHRELFIKRIRKTIIDSPFDIELLADITFYKDTEKRGFRAKMKGYDVSWRDLHLFVLDKKTKRNIRDWFVIQKQK